MQLNLHAYRQPIAQYPASKSGWIEPSVNCRKQDWTDALELMLAHDFDGPLIIHLIAHHELHLVAHGKVRKIGPQVFFRFARTRRLDIHDPGYTAVHLRYIQRPAGLQGHGIAGVTKVTKQIEAVPLRQRLATCNSYVARTKGAGLRQDFSD